MAKSRISASDFLSMIEEENQHIKRDINRQTYLGQRPEQAAHESSTPSKPEPKTEHKADTKWQQTDNKQVTEKNVNRLQTGNKEETNRLQTGNKEITGAGFENLPVTRFENKRVTERVTGDGANRVQTGNKQVTILHFETLRGHEAKLLWLVFNKCRSTGELLSPPITLDQISSHLLTAKNTAKTIVSRVVKKGFLTRNSSATGRGGFTRFRIEKSLYQAMLISETDNKRVTNGAQTDNKEVTKRVTERVTSAPVVVVSSNNVNTTTTEEPCFMIPPALQGMVSRKQLTQFVLDGKIEEWDLQLSLDAFAYDFKNGLIKSKSSNPIAVLIGAIKNNGGYNSVKYADLLKKDLRPVLEAQQSIKDSISTLKDSEGWAKYQSLKKTNPEAFEGLVKKYRNQNLPEAMIDDFGFMEFKEKEI